MTCSRCRRSTRWTCAPPRTWSRSIALLRQLSREASTRRPLKKRGPIRALFSDCDDGRAPVALPSSAKRQQLLRRQFQLHAGLDEVWVLADDILVQLVDLFPAVLGPELLLGDHREVLALLDDVCLRRGRRVGGCFLADLGVGEVVVRGLVLLGREVGLLLALLVWHISPPVLRITGAQQVPSRRAMIEQHSLAAMRR